MSQFPNTDLDKPLKVDIIASHHDGNAVKYKLLGSVRTREPYAVINLREPLEALLHNAAVKTPFRTHTMVRDLREPLTHVLDKVGQRYDDHLFDSRHRRRLLLKGGAADRRADTGICKQEFSCSLYGLVTVLVWFVLSKKMSKSGKDAASF